MSSANKTDKSPELTPQSVKRAWELAQASNVAYDFFTAALEPKFFDEDGRLKITTDEILSDIKIDTVNYAAGDRRDLFRRLVNTVGDYALMDNSPYESPLA